MLFQKRDGRFYLAVWQGVSSFDTKANTDIEPAPKSVTLAFRQAISTARTYLPTFQGRAVQNSYSKPKSISIQAPDHVLLVEITPAKR